MLIAINGWSLEVYSGNIGIISKNIYELGLGPIQTNFKDSENTWFIRSNTMNGVVVLKDGNFNNLSINYLAFGWYKLASIFFDGSMPLEQTGFRLFMLLDGQIGYKWDRYKLSIENRLIPFFYRYPYQYNAVKLGIGNDLEFTISFYSLYYISKTSTDFGIKLGLYL